MAVLLLYQEFDVKVYEMEQWTLPPHQHNFFEIIYVLEGKGTHLLNKNGYGYTKGSLFFLTPDDTHAFDIHEKTKFCIITFNKIFFAKEKRRGAIDFREIFEKIELILSNIANTQSEPISSKKDSKFIAALIEQLIVEIKEKNFFYESISQNIIFLILNLIAKNIQLQLNRSLKTTTQQNEIQDIVFYIQQNIYKKNKLSITAMADFFNKSKNYINEYFKEHTGNTLKDYIMKYKLNLIKNRLSHSDMTISQIADEFGFTDESHLNKTFKQTFNMTAKEYKNQHLK